MGEIVTGERRKRKKEITARTRHGKMQERVI